MSDLRPDLLGDWGFGGWPPTPIRKGPRAPRLAGGWGSGDDRDMDLTRPTPPDPYSLVPAARPMTLTSTDVLNGEPLPRALSAEGEDLSPALAWRGAPNTTQSFRVTMYDPDAPVIGGWWHWNILDLAPDVTSLPAGAGQSDLTLPGAAFHLRNDGGAHAYGGPLPPEGDRPHRYYIAVEALDIDTLDLDEDASPALAAFTALRHVVARGILMGTYQR